MTRGIAKPAVDDFKPKRVVKTGDVKTAAASEPVVTKPLMTAQTPSKQGALLPLIENEYSGINSFTCVTAAAA